MKNRFLILIFVCFSFFGVCQKIRKSFTEILKNGNDTLNFYARQSNCDSIIFYKYQFFKIENDFTVQSFFPVIETKTKRCYDLDKKAPHKLRFRSADVNLCSSNFIDQFKVLENKIKSIDELQAKCNSQYIFYLSIKSKKFKSKKRNCGQTILDEISEMIVYVLIKD